MNNPETVKDDITYLRRMAEEGRRAPILGGVFLAGAGVIFGIACFIQWTMLLRHIEGWLPVLELWLGAMALFALVWTFFFLQLRGKGQALTGASNTAFHSSWLGSGIGITVCCIGVAMAGAFARQPAVMLAYPPMVFAFYGTAWLVSGVLARRRWMVGAAAAAYVFVIVLGALSMSPWQLPAMGVALWMTLTVPGVLLMREKAL